MAITSEALVILQAMLAGLEAGDLTTLSFESTQDLSLAVNQLITAQRATSMTDAVAALVTGSVSDWSTLTALTAIADGATIYATLASFTAAQAAHDSNAMLAYAVAHCLAQKKQLGV